jgi:hypothetical protein
MAQNLANCLVRGDDFMLAVKKLHKKIPCPADRGFLAVANSNGREQKDCFKPLSLGI